VTATTLTSIVLIALAAALAPALGLTLARWVAIPSTVIEIVLGILIGPAVFGLAQADAFVATLSDFGLVLLFFMAGYEIDFARIRGGPLARAGGSWAVSLVIALGVGALLAALSGGGAMSGFTIGLALTTTALGALLPVLRDAGILPQRLGAKTMAVGAVGEFAPLVAVAVLLSGRAPMRSIVILGLFALIAVAAAMLAGRPMPARFRHAIHATLRTSGQFAVRVIVLVVLALVWLATELGLDVILGAFAAGVTIRLLLSSADEPAGEAPGGGVPGGGVPGHPVNAPGDSLGKPAGPHGTEVIESKLDGLAFGLFVPFFFVFTGLTFDLNALLSSATAIALVPIGLIAFLIVRALPAGFAFRHGQPRRETAALGLFAATQLPLVVVITGIGVDNGWLSPAISAGLVGAAMLSVLLFPMIALKLAREVE
jgi:Kef-type K+ transport system membrane component KefB